MVKDDCEVCEARAEAWVLRRVFNRAGTQAVREYLARGGVSHKFLGVSPGLRAEVVSLLEELGLEDAVPEWIAEGWGATMEPTEEMVAAALLMEAKTQDACAKDGESDPSFPQALRECARKILALAHPETFAGAKSAFAIRSTDDDRCPKSESGIHEPDPTTIVAVDYDPGVMVVDVKCQLCGRTGSAQVAREDVNW